MSQQEEFKKKMWNVVTPHIYGDQAPKTPTKAISIYDIEREKQLARDLENANAQGEAYGLARLSTPVYQPTVTDVPIIENSDEILAQQPKAEKEEQKPKSFFSQFVEITTPPITAEEQARRQKAATARQGIQALGNAMSALSNLTFTGMGAPSQALPTQEVEKTGAQITSWQDKLKAEREKYQAAGLNAMAKDYEIAYRSAKDKEARELADRNYTEQVRQFNERQASDKAWKEYQKGEAAQSRKDKLAQQAIENAQRERTLAVSERNASVNEAEETRKADQYNIQHGDRKFFINGEWVTIPKDRWEGVVGDIYNNLPEEVKNMYETQVKDELGIKTTTRKAPTAAMMDNAVRQYISDKNVQASVLKAAGVSIPSENDEDLTKLSTEELAKRGYTKDENGNILDKDGKLVIR